MMGRPPSTCVDACYHAPCTMAGVPDPKWDYTAPVYPSCQATPGCMQWDTACHPSPSNACDDASKAVCKWLQEGMKDLDHAQYLHALATVENMASTEAAACCQTAMMNCIPSCPISDCDKMVGYGIRSGEHQHAGDIQETAGKCELYMATCIGLAYSICWDQNKCGGCMAIDHSCDFKEALYSCIQAINSLPTVSGFTCQMALSQLHSSDSRSQAFNTQQPMGVNLVTGPCIVNCLNTYPATFPDDPNSANRSNCINTCVVLHGGGGTCGWSAWGGYPTWYPPS